MRDFPHAVEYLRKAAQAAFGAGTKEASVWLDEWAPKLKREDPDETVAALRQILAPTPEAAKARVARLLRSGETVRTTQSLSGHHPHSRAWPR
jgi:hypothetical protein